MNDAKKDLKKISESAKERFALERRVLSFQQYLEVVRSNPAAHTRDAALYLKGCFDYFGSYEVALPTGAERRWKVFDGALGRADDDNADHHDHLIGQQRLQEDFYRTLESFEHEGRANRLILLVGPNGSAKSTFAHCVMRALEAYSEAEEGALYRFSWVFPRNQGDRGIGFATMSDMLPKVDSFALLGEEAISAKLASPLREHPLLLIPVEERQALLTDLYKSAGLKKRVPHQIWEGQLSKRNQQIFEALLVAYRGDLERVWMHVQVERYNISLRYRVGAVTIGPEMAVDASERQITADRSLESLPASLSALTLFEPFGQLVDASGGFIEYSDLLKRPVDAWKYLLLAIESGEVFLPMATLPVNAVMVASSNDLHWNAFAEHPEYQSFRGRIVPIRVPYLLNVNEEQKIYETQLVPQIQKHVAPHTIYVAALWAVLTRLRRPNLEYYPAGLRDCMRALTPLEKADLYADGTIPRRLEGEQAKLLSSEILRVRREWMGREQYEGLTGVSPREVRMLVLEAAGEEDSAAVTPVDVLGHIEEFCQRDDYEFLKQKLDGAYYDHTGFVEVARRRWIDLVDTEFRDCCGLLDEKSHMELFDRYVAHVSHWMKGERLLNPLTSKYEEPDADLMRSVEDKLGVEDPKTFRHEVMSAIAAHAIDHPDANVDYKILFPRHLDLLRQAYFNEHREELIERATEVLALFDARIKLEPDKRQDAEATRDRFYQKYNYQESSAKIALGELLRLRYQE